MVLGVFLHPDTQELNDAGFDARIARIEEVVHVLVEGAAHVVHPPFLPSRVQHLTGVVGVVEVQAELSPMIVPPPTE